jgi:hypothetical protein
MGKVRSSSSTLRPPSIHTPHNDGLPGVPRALPYGRPPGHHAAPRPARPPSLAGRLHRVRDAAADPAIWANVPLKLHGRPCSLPSIGDAQLKIVLDRARGVRRQKLDVLDVSFCHKLTAKVLDELVASIGELRSPPRKITVSNLQGLTSASLCRFLDGLESKLVTSHWRKGQTVLVFHGIESIHTNNVWALRAFDLQGYKVGAFDCLCGNCNEKLAAGEAYPCYSCGGKFCDECLRRVMHRCKAEPVPDMAVIRREILVVNESVFEAQLGPGSRAVVSF